MKDNQVNKKYDSVINNHIYWYLLLGVATLLVILFFSYQYAKSSQLKSTVFNLAQSSELSSKFTDNWFAKRFTDLKSISVTAESSNMLQKLTSAYRSSELSLGEYVNSPDWNKRIAPGHDKLISSIRHYDSLHNAYLIDYEGNVLYSLNRESYLGTNVLNGGYLNSKLSNSVKTTIENGEAIFFLTEKEGEFNNVSTGFITLPLFSKSGAVAGVLIAELKLDEIYEALTDISNHAKSPDVKSIYQYITDNKTPLINFKGMQGNKNSIYHKIDLDANKKISKYSGSSKYTYELYERVSLENKKYISIKKLININNVNIFVVTEIEVEGVLALLSNVNKLQILFFIVSLLVIVSIAYYRTYKLLKPVYELTKATFDIASGKSNKRVSVDEKSEVSLLADNFNSIQQIRLDYEQSLNESKIKNNQIVDELNQLNYAFDQHSIVAITDVKGTITFVNELFSEISGYSKDELIGENHRLLKSGVHDKKFFHNMFKQLAKGETFHAEICNKAKDGHLYWVDTTIVPYINKLGKPVSYIAIRTDITRQKQIALELLESKQIINKALDDLNQQKFALDQHSMVSITDVQGTITFVNELFSEVSGYSKEELIGQNHRLLKSGKHEEHFYVDMFKQLVNGQTFNANICNKDKEGRLYWVDTTIVPFINNKGVPESYIAIRTDITKQKQAEVELIKSRDDAEKAVIAKSEFLASMSHEIRTPMNGVLGMLGLLANTKLDEQQLHRVKIAQSSGQALLSLINDILDFSKIDADKLDLKITDFDLRSMLGDLSEVMAYSAQTKGLELVFDVTGIESSMVKGDSSRIRQILTNIVGNAIKFTADGEVVVSTQMSEVDNNGVLLNFTIRDTGIGIPVEKIPTLFDSFSQVDTSTTRKFGGTGLGLAIARKLCILMGGDISVESVIGEGSAFSFTVVMEKSDVSHHVIPQVDMKELNILIVDDNLTNCEVLRGQLEHWGANVVESYSASQALEICEERINTKNISFFDIAFLDMQMPEMDGELLGKTLISDNRFSRMKLVMMTSIGFQEDMNKFYEIGFSAYFSKPTTTYDLFNALSIVVDSKTDINTRLPLITHEYLQAFSHEADINNSDKVYQWPATTRILLVEDNQVNQLVTQGILSAYGLAAEIANNGIEALDMLNTSLNENLYNLVLMDCQMPEMDGYEATRSIRLGGAGVQYKDIPIVAMTANAMMGDREKCIAAGMSDYITKPVDELALYNKLEQVLVPDSINNKSDVTEKINIKNELVTWDKAAVLNRLSGNEELLSTIIDMFKKEMPERIKNLEAAIINNESKTIGSITHSIKGVAANISALQLQNTSSELEYCVMNNDGFEVNKLFSELKSDVAELLNELNNNVSNIKTEVSSITQDEFMEILNTLKNKLLNSDYISAEDLKPLKQSSTNVDHLVLQLIEHINNLDNQLALTVINNIITNQHDQLSSSSE